MKCKSMILSWCPKTISDACSLWIIVFITLSLGEREAAKRSGAWQDFLRRKGQSVESLKRSKERLSSHLKQMGDWASWDTWRDVKDGTITAFRRRLRGVFRGTRDTYIQNSMGHFFPGGSLLNSSHLSCVRNLGTKFLRLYTPTVSQLTRRRTSVGSRWASIRARWCLPRRRRCVGGLPVYRKPDKRQRPQI